MKTTSMKFSIRHTVNLGNYESLSIEAEQVIEIDNPENYGEEVRKALPAIKSGLIRQLEELSDSGMLGKVKGLNSEIKEEWINLTSDPNPQDNVAKRWKE